MNGADLARSTYRRLRRPSQQALPYKILLEVVAEVVARRKLDLALSTQNSLASRSDWFTPTSTDFALDDLGLEGGVFLPIRMERRGIGSDTETGDEVPIVNFDVLNTSIVGAVSFYGDPLRVSFRDVEDTVTNTEYRLVYESDFGDNVTLSSVVGLPDFFASMVSLEAAYELLEIVESSDAEWMNFLKMVQGKWEMQLVDKRSQWDKYVRMFKGKCAVPKRTFFQNQRSYPLNRSTVFRSDAEDTDGGSV